MQFLYILFNEVHLLRKKKMKKPFTNFQITNIKKIFTNFQKTNIKKKL